MNFRGILSKSSLKSSSSGKSLTHTEELSKLQSEIESLKNTVESLKVSVESRDAAIGTIAREKEKIYVELKSAQRTNRNLHQQLVDERDIHSKEKEFLINEIKRLSKRSHNEINDENIGDCHEDQSKNLSDELKSKDEIIYNIGAKYMKMKSSKVILQKKFEKLQLLNKKTCESIIWLLQDNRKTLDSLLDNLLKSSIVPPNSRKFLNLLQINASLHYENTQLKIYLSAKDSTEILHQDSNSGKEPEKYIKTRTRSEFKIRNPRERARGSIHSNLKPFTNHDSPQYNSFKYIHQSFSPKIGDAIYRSASESCIIRGNNGTGLVYEKQFIIMLPALNETFYPNCRDILIRKDFSELH